MYLLREKLRLQLALPLQSREVVGRRQVCHVRSCVVKYHVQQTGSLGLCMRTYLGKETFYQWNITLRNRDKDSDPYISRDL